MFLDATDFDLAEKSCDLQFFIGDLQFFYTNRIYSSRDKKAYLTGRERISRDNLKQYIISLLSLSILSIPVKYLSLGIKVVNIIPVVKLLKSEQPA